MPVIDLQRRLQECGRIRIGQQVPAGKDKTRPARLETFRLTSPDRARIENAARLYGGRVEAWTAPAGPQWEVITEADRLPVIVPPASMAFSQWLELWSGGGCLRRCTGSPIAIDAEQLTDGPCICEQEGQRQCEYHTRLSLLLRDMTGLGLWRLDSQGYYAAIELAGAVDIISSAAGHGMMLPAVLRLEQRVIRRPGETTRRFPVPVLDIQATPAQLLGGSNNGQHELEPAPLRYQTIEDVLTADDPEIAILEANRERGQAEEARRGNVKPIPADSPAHWPTGSIAQQAGVTTPPEDQPPTPAKTSKRKAQPIPATGIAPRTRAQAQADAAKPEPAPRGKARRTSRPSASVRAPSAAGTAPDEAEAAETAAAAEAEAAERGHVTVSAHLGGPEPDPITPEQTTKLSILLEDAGLGDHDKALAWINRNTRQNYTSRKQLSRAEAHSLIDLLERDAEQRR